MVASYDLRPGNGAGPIFWKVRDRRNRREGKTHKKGRRKNTNRKGNPKSTSESQAQITYLLTAPEPAEFMTNLTRAERKTDELTSLPVGKSLK